MSQDPDAIRIRAALTNPRELCNALGIAEKSQPNGNGLLIRCPKHGEKTPSCSVTLRQDGTIGVKCFGCDWGTDAIGLIGLVRGASNFRESLEAAADVAGLSLSPQESRAPAARRNPAPSPSPTTSPKAQPERASQDAQRGPAIEPGRALETPREYPPVETVKALWEAARPIADDSDGSGILAFRAIDPDEVTRRNLARAIPRDFAALPAWARFRGGSWCETGHRILLPVYDAAGATRSVRAWRVTAEGDTPKRLPPSGHAAQGLVLANPAAVRMLRATPNDPAMPCRVLVCEGEPDYLTWATRVSEPVFGIGSGGWTQAHADRIPIGSQVIIRTHRDQAGEKYAAEVLKTLKDRCQVMRGPNIEGDGPQPDENDRAKAGTLPDNPGIDSEIVCEGARVLTVRELLNDSFTRAQTKRIRRSCTTGIAQLDRASGGIRPEFVWVMGAETNWGKSSFLIMLTDDNLKDGKRVMIVTSEDAPSVYADRLMARRAKVSATRLRDGCLLGDEVARCTNVAAKGEPLPVFLDARGMPAESVSANLRQLIAAYRIDLVLIDYLQEMRSEKRHQDRRNEVGFVAGLMRTTIKRGGAGGVIFSQLTMRDGKEPNKHSIRESDDVPNAAEAVLIGSNEVGQNGAILKRKLLVDKMKDGSKGYTIELDWNEESACFESQCDSATALSRATHADANDLFEDG